MEIRNKEDLDRFLDQIVQFITVCPICNECVSDLELHIKEMSNKEDVEHVVFHVHEL